MLAHDLVSFVQTILHFLQLGALKEFCPLFELVGSMAESTRVGIANELDLGMKFHVWREHTPFTIKEDPFSLKRADTSPPIMDKFFDENVFQFHKFMEFLLHAVEEAVDLIFREKKSPPNLKCVTTNKDWRLGKTPCNGQCKSKLVAKSFVQCRECAVVVSQTKSGIALQLEWEQHDKDKNKMYCSIDIIPIFPIEKIPVMGLARLINENMLCAEAPAEWLSFIFKYSQEYKVNREISHCGSGYIVSVGMKTMNFLQGRNHYIKPAQNFTHDKFSSPRMKEIYGYIKFLKKALSLDISSYWIKKELLKEEYQSILDLCTEGTSVADKDDIALVQILSQPAFKMKVMQKININRSLEEGFIRVRR